MSEHIYDFSARSIKGEEISMSTYKGKAVLVVNTASKCGFTPQYAGLQELHQKYGEQGLAILGFPCDQFGHQEPGDESEIEKGCLVNYGVTFQMFSKIDVNGRNAHPLYKFLRREKRGLLGGRIPWNFTKFLIDRNGTVHARYSPATTPEALSADIESSLRQT